MQDVIEKQKQSMIAQIEKHAAKMNRHLDELMLSHKALAQNMTKGFTYVLFEIRGISPRKASNLFEHLSNIHKIWHVLPRSAR